MAVVSAGHRAPAFAACADLVEEVKARVPIWKHQFFEDGTDEWVNPWPVARPSGGHG